MPPKKPTSINQSRTPPSQRDIEVAEAKDRVHIRNVHRFNDLEQFPFSSWPTGKRAIWKRLRLNENYAHLINTPTEEQRVWLHQACLEEGETTPSQFLPTDFAYPVDKW